MTLADQIAEGVELAPFNTLRLPARARYFARATRRDDLAALLRWAHDRGVPCLVLGGGSNIVLRDDFPGLVLHVALRGRRWQNICEETAILELEAGENWHETVLYAARTGYRGIENLALIPGTVGAAPIQNIGAYGVELADTLVDVEVLDTRSLTFRRLSRDDCRFAYRDSLFKQEPGRYIIVQVRLELSRCRAFTLSYRDLAETFDASPTAALTPRRIAETIMAIRRAKLPDPEELPNAGSFFKNPVVALEQYQDLKARFPDLVAYPDTQGMKLAAGWLIDASGWKGYRNDNVGIHRRQALVLINHADGTGQQILDLASKVQSDIHRRFGVHLEIEPRVVPESIS